MEAAQTKELSGEKASRIVEAMRASVARRGISGSTFEHVAREAGVSRGLLHYYFGTKEALLVEVVRRDAEHRVARLDEPLAAASSADEILQILVADLQGEVGELFNTTRDHIAEVFRAKEREGVLKLRTDADAVVGFLVALADGI